MFQGLDKMQNIFTGHLEVNHRRCVLCWSQYRLERDHINESHGEKSPENIRILCKYHHSQKGITKLGRDLFRQLIYEVDKDPKLRTTMRFYSEKRMLEYKDASNFPFRGNVVNEDASDLYKENEVAAIITRIVTEDTKQDLRHSPDGL
jgi:hypothetical protein